MALQSTTALATVTLQAATPTVTFSGIPNTYRDLILVLNGGSTGAAINAFIAFNGDTTSTNYAGVQMSGTGSARESTILGGAGTRLINYYGYLSSSLTTLITVQIVDYSATDKHKTYLSRSNNSSNGVSALASRWANLSAINALTVSAENSTFLAGSTFSLYGRIA